MNLPHTTAYTLFVNRGASARNRRPSAPRLVKTRVVKPRLRPTRATSAPNVNTTCDKP